MTLLKLTLWVPLLIYWLNRKSVFHLVNHEQIIICTTYRVSPSKPDKVILLWWGYRLWFLLIFRILRVHEKGTFMPNSSVFVFMMLRAIYGSISQNILFLNKFWIILTFRGLFQVIKNNKPSKIYIFTLK